MYNTNNNGGRDQFLPEWILILAALFCFAAISDMPYAYYTFTRSMTFGVSIATAVQLYRNRYYNEWVWVLVIVAIFFNPIIPFRLTRYDWRIYDFTAGAMFLNALYMLRVYRTISIHETRCYKMGNIQGVIIKVKFNGVVNKIDYRSLPGKESIYVNGLPILEEDNEDEYQKTLKFYLRFNSSEVAARLKVEFSRETAGIIRYSFWGDEKKLI